MKAILSARIAVIDFLYDTLFKVTDWLQERRDKAMTAWNKAKAVYPEG